MKNSIYALFASLMILFIIQGCNKSSDLAALSGTSAASKAAALSATAGQLIASKATVKIGEPDTLLLVGAANDSIKWSVTPSTGYRAFITEKNTARVIFSKSGSYTVSASANGGTPATKTLTVTDSVYNVVPVTYGYVPLTGDQITLTPAVYTDKAADTSYVYFKATTQNSYCSSSVLSVAYSLDGSTFNLNFLNVIQPSPCSVSNAPISKTVAFTSNSPAAFANGTYPLNVILNGVTYTGSFTATATTITFNWNYTAGVVLSTKQISR